MNLIDIHSHLNFEDFDLDREEILKEMNTMGIGTITVGTGIKTSEESVLLSENWENIYATVGLHPNDSKEEDPMLLERFLYNKKVVAIGECGLDFFRVTNKDEAFKKQLPVFEQQINLAIKYDKPLMIHARSSYKEVADILKSYKNTYGEKLRGDMHFFAGDVDDARNFLDLGFTLSFTGVLTFVGDYDEVVNFTPLDMIMSETDAPYVSPAPFRGKRNSPLYIEEVVKAISRIKKMTFEEVNREILKNASRVFGIKTD